MFIQVVQGRVKDPGGISKALDRWNQELKPGAKGWLGATSGFTKDNGYIAVVRFADEKSARANSDRPEQGEWFTNEMSKNFEGQPTFFDSTDVETFGAGGSDDAGFVQIITGKALDRKRMQEVEKEMSALPNQRPDVIGGTTAYSGDKFVTVVYFTSEKEARAGESKGFEGEAKRLSDEMMSLMTDVQFIDLNEPRLESP